jgi:DNA-binding transcriptional MerR regulator
MTELHISEVARRSGIPSTTLRYYEGIGLIPAPPRSESGYRLYDERILSRLALISRAKALGVQLDDMPDLVRLLDGERCEPVAERLIQLVANKRAEVSERMAELGELGRSLDRVAIELHSPSPGACGDDCTLDRASAEERLWAWSAVAQRATSRENIEGGMRLGLNDDVDLGEVARLAAAESICCPMFEFRITVDDRGRAIEMRVPDGDAEIVRQLLGAKA